MLECVGSLEKDIMSYLEFYRTEMCPYVPGTKYTFYVTGTKAGRKNGYMFTGAKMDRGRHLMLTFTSPDGKGHEYFAYEVYGSGSEWAEMMISGACRRIYAYKEALEMAVNKAAASMTDLRPGDHVEFMAGGKRISDRTIEKITYDAFTYGHHQLVYDFLDAYDEGRETRLTEDEVENMTVI
jgi:hypothetical protein